MSKGPWTCAKCRTEYNASRTANCAKCYPRPTPCPDLPPTPPFRTLVQDLYGEMTAETYFDEIQMLTTSVDGIVSVDTIFEPTEELSGLYHGNITAATDPETIARLRIGIIVQAAGDTDGDMSRVRAMDPSPTILALNMRDRPDQSLDPILRILPELARARRMGTNILVNCHVGMSRSTAVVLAHLMDPDGHNMTLLDAWRCLKTKRPMIFPNIGFLVNLMALEDAMRGSISVPHALVLAHPAFSMTFDGEGDYRAFMGERRRMYKANPTAKRGGTRRSKSKKRTSRSRASRHGRRS